ncbi:hypothetical protein ACJW31_05G155400 [Castanea mollissima]
MKHGCGVWAAAPASDAATRRRRRCLRVRAASGNKKPFFPARFGAIRSDSRRYGADSGRRARNRADSARIGPYRVKSVRPKSADTGRNSKKKNKKNNNRLSHIPAIGEPGRWAWIGLFCSELWFCFYWFVTTVVRWNPIYRNTFKDRLSHRYEKALPGIDIFVCTADPVIEPPVMVINTILSVMAYDYPPEKLNVYLSDDGASEFTFYAMLEASRFSKIWLPFCKKFKVEPRSPEAYFRTAVEPLGEPVMAKEWSTVKMLYEDMKNRIESITKLGRISEEISKEHKGFNEWILVASPRDHQTILQILIDGRDSEAVDIQGRPLPTLVYLAREKRPQYHHHFKAGAMNAMIRVSSRISNSSIILNVDCDMYSNNSTSIREALCFFMDGEKGNEVGFVQFPQAFENLTKNDVYSSSLNVIMEMEMPGYDGNGGSCYIGTGCFHRRETLSGQKYSKNFKADWKRLSNRSVKESTSVLEEKCKVLASSSYEENSQWGKEMGLKYDCAVEDLLTGLSIQCRGWKSIYFNPERKGFLGVAPITLLQSLVQHKRWSEGDFHIFASRNCPFVLGYKKIPLKLQLSYCIYLLWAPNCLTTLYYVIVPSLCLLRGISLFPHISSSWVLAFVFVIFLHRTYSLGEFIRFGGTFKGWWNDQRMWLYKRTTSYFFGLLDYILKRLGFSKSAFVVTTKVADDDVSQRYEQEVMEFGTSSPMFTILATLALLNAFCFLGALKRVIANVEILFWERFALQILLCGLLVLINLPVYQELWFSFYWFVTTVVRWNPIYRNTFKDRLSHRYEKALPGIDIFVCTADPVIEPPVMVISTVLSVMAYDYPPEKLSVYLSDDGGSDLTFYAMLEASRFSKIWLPFCKKFKVEPRSPEAYFRTAVEPLGEPIMAKDWSTVKKLYEDMKKRIENTTKLGRISEEISKEHKGFNEWIFVASRRDHQTILQILIDGRESEAVDIQGQILPTLVYLSREKRPQYHHHFKAGAMNALIGLKYDCAVEDVLTGIAMQCRGWRSIYFTPERKGFLGVAPTTLLQSLVQHKRWSEGDFHIFASRHCPFVLGYKKIPLKLQLTYCMNLLWAANCLATLYYVIVPSLCLHRGISLFPEITNSWVLAFVFVIIVHRAYSLGEFVWFGGTFKGWWNDQRMWLYKRTTSYFFGFLDYILKRLGFTNSAFVITTKVAGDDVSQRYEQEVMEFGTSSPMFTILATLALLNAICFVSGLKRVIADVETLVWEKFALHIFLCGLLVFINLPIYQGLFFRKDVASLPTSVTYQSTMFALLACAIAVY